MAIQFEEESDLPLCCEPRKMLRTDHSLRVLLVSTAVRTFEQPPQAQCGPWTRYLRKQMNSEGWVNIHIIAGFNRLRTAARPAQGAGASNGAHWSRLGFLSSGDPGGVQCAQVGVRAFDACLGLGVVGCPRRWISSPSVVILDAAAACLLPKHS